MGKHILPLHTGVNWLIPVLQIWFRRQAGIGERHLYFGPEHHQRQSVPSGLVVVPHPHLPRAVQAHLQAHPDELG